MSENWTCVMTKRLTWTQHAESSELFFAHVDDLCRKRSAFVTKRNDGRHRLTPVHVHVHDGRISSEESDEVGSKKGQKGNSSMGMPSRKSVDYLLHDADRPYSVDT